MESINRKERLQFEGNLDFLELADWIDVLLQTAWGKNWGKFKMQSGKTLDPKNIDFPIITFQLKEQKPGVVGNNKVRERKPRLRGEYRSKKNPSEVINEYGQRIDAIIQFSVYGKTNLEAIRLSEDFMQFIDMYKSILQKYGLQNIWFKSETEDDDNPIDSVYVRKINYMVVFEKIYREDLKKVKEINVKSKIVWKELKVQGKLPSQQGKHKEDYK